MVDCSNSFSNWKLRIQAFNYKVLWTKIPEIQYVHSLQTLAGSYIPTQELLANNRAIVNVKYEADNVCIALSLLAHK